MLLYNPFSYMTAKCTLILCSRCSANSSCFLLLSRTKVIKIKRVFNYWLKQTLFDPPVHTDHGLTTHSLCTLK